MRINPDTCRDPDLLAAEVRRLQAILDAMPGFTVSLCSENEAIGETDDPPEAADAPTVPPEWLAQPYWVDPPSGWAYGFPRLYDPQADGDMTEWMIAKGYPARLARIGLPCTFTAATENDSTGTDCTESGEK